MKNVNIKQSSEEDFFKRGRAIAKLADAGKPIPEQTIISFESATDLARIVTPGKLAVFEAVKANACSITDLAKKLHRDRSAVKRDVDELENAGLVNVQVKTLPGHGRMKEVTPAAAHFKLEVCF